MKTAIQALSILAVVGNAHEGHVHDDAQDAKNSYQAPSYTVQPKGYATQQPASTGYVAAQDPVKRRDYGYVAPAEKKADPKDTYDPKYKKVDAKDDYEPKYKKVDAKDDYEPEQYKKAADPKELYVQKYQDKCAPMIVDMAQKYVAKVLVKVDVNVSANVKGLFKPVHDYCKGYRVQDPQAYTKVGGYVKAVSDYCSKNIKAEEYKRPVHKCLDDTRQAYEKLSYAPINAKVYASWHALYQACTASQSPRVIEFAFKAFVSFVIHGSTHHSYGTAMQGLRTCNDPIVVKAANECHRVCKGKEPKKVDLQIDGASGMTATVLAAIIPITAMLL